MGLSMEEICNDALGLIGENPITDINENETKAIRCRQFWQPTVQACLRMHTWNFATRRALLSMCAEAPAFGYSFAYQVPADCLYLAKVTDDVSDIDSSDISAAQVEYKVEYGQVLSSSEVLYCKYVCNVVETGRFDPLFASYVSARLASKIAASLTKSAAIVNSTIQLAVSILSDAWAADVRESGTAAVRKSSSWLASRG